MSVYNRHWGQIPTTLELDADNTGTNGTLDVPITGIAVTGEPWGWNWLYIRWQVNPCAAQERVTRGVNTSNGQEMTRGEGMAQTRSASLDKNIVVVVGNVKSTTLIKSTLVTRGPENPSYRHTWARTESVTGVTVLSSRLPHPHTVLPLVSTRRVGPQKEPVARKQHETQR